MPGMRALSRWVVLGMFALCWSDPAAAAPPVLEVQEVESTFSLPKGAFLSPDGKHVYVTNFGQENQRNISVYDGVTLAPEGTIDVPGNVVEAAVSPDGGTLYVSNFRRSSVMFINTVTKQVEHEIKTGTHPKTLALSPDGTQLFAANWASNDVTQIDVKAALVTRTLRVGRQPRGIVVSKTGVLYVANFYDDSVDVFEGPNLETKRRMPVCKCPRHLALSPDQGTLYIACLTASELAAVDVGTGQVSHRVPVGRAPKTLAVSADGNFVYTADFGTSHSITAVDTRDWVPRTFAVPGMDRGCGVTVSADGHYALVTGWFDNHIYRVGFAGEGGDPKRAEARLRAWRYRPKTEYASEQ